MKSKVYDIIVEALKKAEVDFDADGTHVWVHPPKGGEGRTVTVDLVEWDADEDGAREDAPSAEPAKNEDGLHRYMVSLHADMAKLFEVAAPDEAAAEEALAVRWENDEITLGELSLAETRIAVTARLD